MNPRRVKRMSAWSSGILMVLLIGTLPSTAFAQEAKPITRPKPARLADGKPNWTGFWVPVDGMMEVYRGPSFLIRSPDDQAPTGMRNNIAPLKSPYKEQYERIGQERAAGKISFDPNALCLPPGMPRMMTMIYGMELLQTPGQITITSEFMAASRRIWLDRNTHPDAEELDPTYTGDSIARWQGDTLVVDTIGIRDDVQIDSTGLPMSGKLHVTERFTQIKPGILQDEITVDDPEAYAAPWKMVKVYRHRPDLRLREYVCQENNRNVGPNGQPVFH